MDGNLLFSLCNRVEEQVFQTWDNFRLSSPAKVAERHTNETLKETLLILTRLDMVEFLNNLQTNTGITEGI